MARVQAFAVTPSYGCVQAAAVSLDGTKRATATATDDGDVQYHDGKKDAEERSDDVTNTTTTMIISPKEEGGDDSEEDVCYTEKEGWKYLNPMEKMSANLGKVNVLLPLFRVMEFDYFSLLSLTHSLSFC